MLATTIYSFLILIIFFILFSIIGIYVEKKIKNINSKNYFLLGFISFIALFEIIALPCLFFSIPFTIFFILISLIILCITVFIIYKERIVLIDKLKIMMSDKYIILTILISLFISFISLMLSSNKGDAWLYTPMVISTIEQNQLNYITDGVHAFDSYYLFVSYFISFAGKNYEAFLMLFYTIFQCFLFMFAISFVTELVFKKRKFTILVLTTICMISFSAILMPANPLPMPFLQLLSVKPSGTGLLYVVSISLLFIYLVEEMESRLFLFIIVLSGLAFSSSMTYIYFTFSIISVVYYTFWKKEKFKNNLKNITLTIIPVFFVTSLYLYINIPIIFNSIESIYYFILSIVFSLAILLFTILIFSKKLLFKCFKILIYFSIIAFFIVLISIFITNNDGIHNTINYIKMAPFDQKFSPRSYAFLNLTVITVNTILIFIGLFYAYRHRKSYFRVFVLVIVLFGTVIIFQTFGKLLGSVTYERVVALSCPFIFAGFGLVFFIEKLGSYVGTKKVIFLTALLFLCSYSYSDYSYYYEELAYDFTQPYSEFLYTADTYQLMEYEFPEHSKMYCLDCANKNEKNPADIAKFNTNVTIEYDYAPEFYFLVPKKLDPQIEKLDPVFETDNYLLYPPLDKNSKYYEKQVEDIQNIKNEYLGR